MKNFNFLQVVIAGLLLVTAVSCTPTQYATYDEDDNYTTSRRPLANRIYVDDPYAGTVILERDPWTGRYYQVAPGGFYSPYRWNDRYFNNGWGSPYNRNPNISRPRGGYQQPQRPQKPAPSPDQRQKEREEARKRILGN